MKLYLLMSVITLLLAFTLQAAEPVRVGLHLSAPWSFYNEAKELDGMEYQLVSRIFSRAGLKVEYELHSYSRLLKQFSDKKLDCASPVAVPVAGASYTVPYLPFEDVVISLASSATEITSLQQLAGKRIVAYQQAQQVLGAQFSAAVADANYLELADRALQLELLFSNRVDLVIGERRVLLYLANKTAPRLTLKTHHLFAEQKYPAACWDPALKEVFNRGLELLQQSGELADILQQYNHLTAIGTE